MSIQPALLDLLAPKSIAGLNYIEDYITASQETALIDSIDQYPWSLELLRRRQWYGHAYDDATGYVAQPMPAWLTQVAQALYADGHLDGVADRALVNEYTPGQGIGAHRDRDIDHIKAVGIISLGSGAAMDFTRLGHETYTRYLHPRSLTIMRGEARQLWMHGITGRKSDRLGGLVLPRQRRLSLTFRYANP